MNKVKQKLHDDAIASTILLKSELDDDTTIIILLGRENKSNNSLEIAVGSNVPPEQIIHFFDAYRRNLEDKETVVIPMRSNGSGS